MKRLISVLLIVLLVAVAGFATFADEAELPENAGPVQTGSSDDATGTKAVSAAIVVAVVAAAGAIGMAIAIAKSTEGMARQPEIASKINSSMMLGLVFIETAIIYALIVAILIIFVL